jgi:septal ring factor EnvC (AmiA/AmiB activator)
MGNELVKRKAFVRRRLAVTVALLASTLLVLGGTIAPATAEPVDPDGSGNQSVREKLDTAAQAYNDAKGRLDASRARQGELQQRLGAAERRLTELDTEVGPIAAAAYRGNRLNVSLVLLDAASPAMLHDAATIDYLAQRDDREIRSLVKARKDYAEQKAALDNEVKLQEQQLAEMEKRKRDAERALGNPNAGAALGAGLKASANPAPRNSDGSWPRESCSVKDPTTSGCLTPRTLHALQEARAAGFDHFTACYRSGGGGEHPKGRACDLAANASGFQNARATGADKAYGDQLAGWCIANSDRLGVLYVIWYKQVWFPGLGWRAYTSGDGTPAGDHYNHVHLSVH